MYTGSMRRRNGFTRRVGGFTLIELLVVVAIIGVLAMIGLTSFASAQARARDARRREDMQAISKALEEYYLVNDSSYPATVDCAGYEAFISGPEPTDPKPPRTYTIACPAPAGTSFCICASLEVVGVGNSPDSSCDFAGAGSKDYYCLENLQ